MDDPPRLDCPNLGDGPGPTKIEKTGEYQCITCLRILGVESATSDELSDDDVIDEENAEEVEYVFTGEGDKIQSDFTDEQRLVVDRKDKITEIIRKISSIDPEYAMYLSENQDDIISILREMETAGEPSFETNILLTPKILGVTSHLIKRHPTTKAMKALRVKPSRIEASKSILDKLRSPSIENEVSRAIDSIGKRLDVPDAIIKSAIEEYEKNRPTNKEPKKRALAAAWLYLYAKKSKFKINKTRIYANVSGVSRAAFSKAVESYEIYFRNLKGSLKEPKVEDK